MFTKEQDHREMQKKTIRNLFLFASIPLIFAIVMATYYGNQNRPNESLVAVLKNLAPIGEIVQTDLIETHFKCPVDKFESFSLMAATYKRINTAHYKLSLYGGELYGKQEFLIDSSKLKDNTWVRFTLTKPFERCRGRPLKLLIDSTDASSGNAITFYTASRYYEGKIMLPIRADLYNTQLALEINTAPPIQQTQSEDDATSSTPALATAADGAASLSSKLDALDHFGEVIAGEPIEQSVVCPVTQLTTIRFMPATYQRSNTARYKLTLSDSKGIIQAMNFSGLDVRDNAFFRVRLDKPIEKCKGQNLTIKIESQNAKPGNALTFYHRPSYYDGVLKAGQKVNVTGRQLLIQMNY
jgi:hypothetical protein